MRKVFYLMAAAAIVLAGCKKVNEETPVKDPEIKLTSTEDITVSHEGGTAAIAYEIVNPVDGGIISATTPAEWITDFNYDTEGEVSFLVAANTETEKRNATVTLTYTYADGKTVKADANLVQDAYTEVSEPVIKLDETEISVSAAGGQSEIAVEIVNPAEDGEIKAAADADWITVTSATATAIVLDIAENTESSARSGEVSVTYTYGEGEKAEAKITVNQEAAVPEPELVITETSINVTAAGGQSEIAVEIVNPANDGELKAVADAGWITVTSATVTAIVLDIAENTETSERSGEVSVTYTYGEGEKAEAKITVNQEAAVPEPELSIPQSPITVPADGGESEVAIEIINPTANGKVVAVSKTSWITVTSASTSSVILNIDANVEPATREGHVTVSYIYDETGSTIEADITVNQEAKAQSEYDYEYVMVKTEGSYWSSGYNSYITFSDTDYNVFNEPNAVFYKFDFYSDGPNNRLPTAGTYTYNKNPYVQMTFAHQSSSTTAYDENGDEKYLIKFADGTVNISYEGDNMIMEGFLTDENGDTHHITYNGLKPSL